MPGLTRDLRLALALPLVSAFACTIDNPTFGVARPDRASATDVAATDSASTAAGTTTGADPTNPATSTPEPTVGTSTSSTTEPTSFCGDGTVDPGELCDDGNLVAGDGCEPDCSTLDCGDGVVGGAEQCDDGNQVDTDDCLNTCAFPQCGDGIVHDGKEQCDDGNFEDQDSCTASCLFNFCGDDLLNPGVEQCDDGNFNPGDGCDGECSLETCGDGVVQPPEVCDDGNDVDNDVCKNDCSKNNCGDMLFDPNTEQCDWSAEPFNKYLGLCSDICTLNSCVKMTNTDDTNLVGVDWFKPCITAPGTKVHVAVLNSNQQLSYFASGLKNNVWSEESITSAAPAGEQYVLGNHKAIVLSKDGDRLVIPGRSSLPNNIGCPSSLGDGYAVIILPAGNDNPKLLFMPNVGKSGKVRNFKSWSAGHELSINPNGMQLCAEPGPTAALNITVLFAVSP